MRRYELIPNDSHKSFYGKAYVQVDDAGRETLYSYSTAIIARDVDGSLTRIWGGWSATTGRHIRAFCGLSKQEFTAMRYTNVTGGRPRLRGNPGDMESGY